MPVTVQNVNYNLRQSKPFHEALRESHDEHQYRLEQMNLNKLDDLLSRRGFDLDQSQSEDRPSEMRRSFQAVRNSQARRDVLAG